MKKLYPIPTFSFFFLLFSYLTFIIGFYFNENSSGGGAIDFKHSWVTVNLFKDGIINALTDIRYESSRPPLFAILNSINPFNETQNNLRISNFIFNCFIPIFYYFLLKKQSKFSNNTVFLITSILLLSPYFRTTSYWALEENLPFLFMFITLILLPLNNIKYSEIILIAFTSSLSVYSDQKFVFLSFFTYLYFLNNKKNFFDFFKISVIYFLTSIPFIILIFMWKGISPVEAQNRFTFNPTNIVYINSIIILYFIPFCLYLFLEKKLTEILKNISKKDLIVLIFFFLFNIFLIPNFETLWGNGVISKLFYYLISNQWIDIKVAKSLFFLYSFIGTSFIYLSLSRNINNYLPFIILFAISIFVQVVHQEYVDPLIYILIFCYFKFQNIEIKKTKLVVIYLIFSILFLAFANFYYKIIIQV